MKSKWWNKWRYQVLPTSGTFMLTASLKRPLRGKDAVFCKILISRRQAGQLHFLWQLRRGIGGTLLTGGSKQTEVDFFTWSQLLIRCHWAQWIGHVPTGSKSDGNKHQRLLTTKVLPCLQVQVSQAINHQKLRRSWESSNVNSPSSCALSEAPTTAQWRSWA